MTTRPRPRAQHERRALPEACISVSVTIISSESLKPPPLKTPNQQHEVRNPKKKTSHFRMDVLTPKVLISAKFSSSFLFVFSATMVRAKMLDSRKPSNYFWFYLCGKDLGFEKTKQLFLVLSLSAHS